MLGVNNQYPSKLMGNGWEVPKSEVRPGCEYGGGGFRQWHTASWNPIFGEAPCLMGGKEVNSTALKLYLIFIHMNTPGQDRLPQIN